MQQIVYKRKPGSRNYYSRYHPKCNVCQRQLNIGECIVKLDGGTSGVHRSCLETWLKKNPSIGNPAKASATAEQTQKEFDSLRRRIMRELKKKRG